MRKLEVIVGFCVLAGLAGAGWWWARPKPSRAHAAAESVTQTSTTPIVSGRSASPPLETSTAFPQPAAAAMGPTNALFPGTPQASSVTAAVVSGSTTETSRDPFQDLTATNGNAAGLVPNTSPLAWTASASTPPPASTQSPQADGGSASSAPPPSDSSTHSIESNSPPPASVPPADPLASHLPPPVTSRALATSPDRHVIIPLHADPDATSAEHQGDLLTNLSSADSPPDDPYAKAGWRTPPDAAGSGQGFRSSQSSALESFADEMEGEWDLPYVGPTRVYVVQPGDTLHYIAKQELGNGKRWRQLYALNRDFLGDRPDWLLPGDELLLPDETGTAQ